MRHVSSRIGSSTLKRSQNQWVTLLFRWRWQIKFQLRWQIKFQLSGAPGRWPDESSMKLLST